MWPAPGVKGEGTEGNFTAEFAEGAENGFEGAFVVGRAYVAERRSSLVLFVVWRVAGGLRGRGEAGFSF